MNIIYFSLKYVPTKTLTYEIINYDHVYIQ